MKTTGLTSTIPRAIKIPKRNDERVILHFDYDCFYASVFENENPSLRSQPLGIKQKSILATCNYVARARGVKKLMLISEAQKICPDLILMNGEDLTRFRDVSKKLCALLRAHSWNHRVERLGLDEVFLDVTDVVAYNREMLNVHALTDSFFHLDRNNPVKGFPFDGSRFYGCVQPPFSTGVKKTNEAVDVEVVVDNPLCMSLMLASHLVGYLRHKLDEDFGHTSSGGIATNKLLAKLAGNVNKPNNQTTLLCTSNGAVEEFMDAHGIRKIPGIGSRIVQLIEEYLLSTSNNREREGNSVTAGEIRRHPGMSSELLEQILDRPGAERGSGDKVWNLLHGVDPSEVKEASDVPTQISIEDTYMSRPLQTPAEITRELRALAVSLIRRMRVDLTEADVVHVHATTVSAQVTTSTDTDSNSSSDTTNPIPPRWLAYPKTLRLSTRTKPKGNLPPRMSTEASTFNRSSRSAPLPSFVFHFSPHPSSCDEIAERLVTECLLPLFRRLHPERAGGWNLALLNICVTNMVVVASETSQVAGGRDIGRMFQTQKDKLRQWTVYDTSPSPLLPVSAQPNSSRVEDTLECVDGDSAKYLANQDRQAHEQVARSSSPLFGGGDEDAWEDQEESDMQRCEICEHAVPTFAMSAHERFHTMDG